MTERTHGRLLSFLVAAVLVLLCRPAWADKVVVLPFTSQKNVPRPELEEVRRWAREAVAKRGHVFATDAETVSAEAAVKDGIADTRQEYVAAARAAAAEWTLTGHVERNDYPPARMPDGHEEEGYTTYRVELEACQASSGRVESLSREVLPDEGTAHVAEMLQILLRPEGIANTPIPWEKIGVSRPKPRPKPAPPPAPPPPPAPAAPEAPPAPKPVYAEGRPVAIGLSIGFTSALARPDQARGPSEALPIGGALGYAIAAVPGLEVRGNLTSQVIGPRALEVSAGARYALAPFGGVRVFVGPELLLGVHAALGADQTARFLFHPNVFVAWGITELVQVEIAGDLITAFGGSGTLVLAGGTARVLFRF